MTLNRLKSGIFKNASALYLVQIANYIIPLITLPFLTRALGTESYGKFAVIQSILMYGIVMTDYGFQFSATRKIAAMLETGHNVSEIYSNVTAARCLLAITATILILIVAEFLPYLNLTPDTILAIFLFVLCNALTPLWLFQGFQKMVIVSIIVLISRIMGAVITIGFVKNTTDINIAIWAQSLGMMLPVGFAIWRSIGLVGGWHLPTLSGVKSELTEGWAIFQTAIFSTILTNSGIIILGSIAGAHVAGGYAAVERIAKGVASMFVPITQTIYPRVSAAFARNQTDGIMILRKFGVLIFGLSILSSIGLALMVPFDVVGRVFGKEYNEFSSVLFILAPWVVFGILNNLIGIQYLTNIGQQKWYANAFTISGIFAFTLFLLFTPYLSYSAIALGLNLGEGLLTVLLIAKVYSIFKNRRGGD